MNKKLNDLIARECELDDEIVEARKAGKMVEHHALLAEQGSIVEQIMGLEDDLKHAKAGMFPPWLD